MRRCKRSIPRRNRDPDTPRFIAALMRLKRPYPPYKTFGRHARTFTKLTDTPYRRACILAADTIGARGRAMDREWEAAWRRIFESFNT